MLAKILYGLGLKLEHFTSPITWTNEKNKHQENLNTLLSQNFDSVSSSNNLTWLYITKRLV